MMQFVERPEFAKWRSDVSYPGNYFALCRSVINSGVGSFDHLYEFCAMNGHLAAFEMAWDQTKRDCDEDCFGC